MCLTEQLNTTLHFTSGDGFVLRSYCIPVWFAELWWSHVWWTHPSLIHLLPVGMGWPGRRQLVIGRCFVFIMTIKRQRLCLNSFTIHYVVLPTFPRILCEKPVCIDAQGNIDQNALWSNIFGRKMFTRERPILSQMFVTSLYIWICYTCGQVRWLGLLVLIIWMSEWMFW